MDVSKMEVRDDGGTRDVMQKHRSQKSGNSMSRSRRETRMDKAPSGMTGYIMSNEILSAYCVMDRDAPPLHYYYSIQLLLNPCLCSAVVCTPTYKPLDLYSSVGWSTQNPWLFILYNVSL